VLVLKANLVADKNCLAHILESGKTPAVCLMTAAGAKGASDGLYLVDPDHLVPVLHVLWAPGNHQSAILGKVKAIPSINGLPYLIERTGTDARLSEEKLVEALAEETVADDGFIARHFDRRISRFISKRLANTWLTPNQITLAGMTIGLIGALLLAQPGYWPKLVGSLLFVCCVVVDGVDGEVARLKLKESRFGHYLDVVTDNIVHVAVFSGMAFGLYHDTGNVAYLHILLVLMGGFGLCAIAVYQCILRLDPGTMSESSRTVRLMALVTNRDFAYLVLLLAAIDRLPWFLLGAAVGSYFFAIALWCIGSHERRRRSAATNHQAAT
jgi:phosphatidylglycerophosphate synthase